MPGRIVVGAVTTLQLDTQIDPQTLDLYGVADYWKTPVYTGASWKGEIDASGRFGFGASGVSTTNQVQVSFAGSSLNGLLINDTAPTGTPSLLQVKKNGVTLLTIDYLGSLMVSGPSGSIGYSTGSGGAVTQTTSKSTPVTLDKTNGQVTMNAASLAAGAAAEFTINDARVVATDVVVANVGGNFTGYRLEVRNVVAGAFAVRLTNVTGGALAEAVVISFAVIKAVTS